MLRQAAVKAQGDSAGRAEEYAAENDFRQDNSVGPSAKSPRLRIQRHVGGRCVADEAEDDQKDTDGCCSEHERKRLSV